MTMVVDKIFIFLHFMYLLTVPIVKNSHTLAEIYFIFLKEHPRSNLKALVKPDLWLKEKIEIVVIM